MTLKILLLAGTLACAAATARETATNVAPDAVMAARLNRVLDTAVTQQRIVGGVVLVARNGKIVYDHAVGMADRETGRAMTTDTAFRLASMSKPIVTLAAMRLVDQGKLRLDDPVTRYLSDFKPKLADGSTPTITIAQLITHTSGLGYGFDDAPDSAYAKLGVSDGLDASGLTLAQNMQRLAQAPLYFAPGSAWRYSLGIDVLGAVIEKAAGMPLPAAVQTLVTDPLQMQRTQFVANDPQRFAVPYINGNPAPIRMADSNFAAPVPETDGHVIRFSPARAFDADAFPSGGGGMLGTADDYLRLLEAVRTNRGELLKTQTLADMRRDHVGTQAKTQGPGWGFGYGWAVLEDPNAANTPQSRGTLQWGGAYGHTWFVDPQRGLSVILLTNTTPEGMAGPLVAQVRDAVYGSATTP